MGASIVGGTMNPGNSETSSRSAQTAPSLLRFPIQMALNGVWFLVGFTTHVPSTLRAAHIAGGNVATTGNVHPGNDLENNPGMIFDKVIDDINGSVRRTRINEYAFIRESGQRNDAG